MLRTILIVAGLFVAIFWLPIWLQLICFVLAVIFAKHRLVVLLPAIMSDALYSPNTSFALSNLKTTIYVVLMLIVFWIIINKTRIKILYDDKI